MLNTASKIFPFGITSESSSTKLFTSTQSQKFLSSNSLFANWNCFNSECTLLWMSLCELFNSWKNGGKRASWTNRAETGSRSAEKLSETNAVQTVKLESLKADDSFIQFATIFPFVIGSQENSAVDFNLCVLMMRKVDSLNILFLGFFDPAECLREFQREQSRTS